MLLFEYRYELPAYPTMKQRISGKLDRFAERILRPVLIGFVSGILSRAKQDGVISNDQLHELADRISKRLPR